MANVGSELHILKLENIKQIRLLLNLHTTLKFSNR